ncbi:MutS-related protein [Coprobacter secundus]|uniref:DNA mismatch repair protein MutS n=1 Tax=Coprobacter secundus subsp. similis TaxID=2751153 RepID=A0A7G1HY96_9BACT|nr:hypothetical protein [Coprobacter secundus]BCI63414.1 DNA mismatch repair protein MutS [Coprobacter secundus subsp. similis]
MITPENYYHSILRDTNIQLNKTQKKIYSIGTLRLLIVLITLGLLYFLWDYPLYILIPICLFGIILFLILLRVHNRFFIKKSLQEARISIAKKELQLLQYQFDETDEGNEFINTEHDFSNDLDLFGHKSLFSYINRSASLLGRNRLAEILQKPLRDTHYILKRQKAIEELSKLTELRIDFLAHGLTSNEKKSDINTIRNTASLKNVIPAKYIQICSLYIIPVLFTILLLLWIAGISTGTWILYLFIICFTYATIKSKKVSVLQKQLNEGLQSLNSYTKLIESLEKTQFKSQLLQELKQKINIDGTPVSERIKRLTKLLGNLDQRYNAIGFAILNGFLLWDFRQLTAIGKWLDENAGQLDQWLSALAEFDAISSLATFHYNHPNYTFPELIEDDHPVLSAVNMGHPLIPPTRCILNDIDMPLRPSFLVITGANMAGKSTYLRTIGINHVLACIGAPVCAEKMRITPCTLFTSLRTTDSLKDQESYFFAELKRLKVVIDRLKTREKIFIILDEILKGTNSVDKQKGSLALVEQLIELNASGVIATHDLLLGELANSYPDIIRNFRFEADITNDELSFSYRLQPGIAQNMNAYFLMRKMGIIKK